MNEIQNRPELKRANTLVHTNDVICATAMCTCVSIALKYIYDSILYSIVEYSTGFSINR